MTDFKFKDLKGDNKKEGDVVNFLNDIDCERKESQDMVVKYYCDENKCDLYRFRNFDEVELIKK